MAVAKRGEYQNKEIGTRLFISGRIIGHHISPIFFKLDVYSPRKDRTGSCSHGYDDKYYF
jgi:DNA-binding NarL/FixJ family response regulator